MKTRRPKISSIILMAFWLITLTGVLYLGNQTRESVQLTRSMTNILSDDSRPPIPKGLSDKNRLLLYGDLSQDTEEDRWKALHESDPENPLFFVIYLHHAEQLPLDFHDTIARIDPDNGWYALWEVSKSTRAFKKSSEIRLKKSKREELLKNNLPLPPSTYEIIDLEAFNQHLALLEKGLLSPRFESYFKEIATLRFNATPPPRDFSSNINAITISLSTPTSILSYKRSTDALCCALQITKTQRDFEHLEKLCRKLEERVHERCTTLVDGLIYKAIVHIQSKSLRAGAERLKLRDAAEFYRERQLKFQIEQERQQNTRFSDITTELIDQRADVLTTFSLPASHKILPNPPALTTEMLKPALRTERAVVSKIFYMLLLLALSLFGLIVWLRGRNKENPATFIPEGKALLFGSLLPFTLVLIFRYFFSFGMLDFGGRLLIFWNYLLPEIAVLMILIVVPQALTNQKTCPEQSLLKIWWPVLAAILGLIFAAAMMHLLFLSYAVFLLPGIFMITAFIWTILQVYNRPNPDFDRNGRIAPCYLLSAALCGLFAFGLVIEERYWFQQDDVNHASATGLSHFEIKTTKLLNEFVHELRGPDRQQSQ